MTVSYTHLDVYKRQGQGLWIGRPVEWPGSRPLTLEPEIGPDFGGLSEWALENVVKVLCFCHPEDAVELRAEQEAVISRLFAACRRNRLEMLLEVIPSKVGPVSYTHLDVYKRQALPAAPDLLRVIPEKFHLKRAFWLIPVSYTHLLRDRG